MIEAEAKEKQKESGGSVLQKSDKPRYVIVTGSRSSPMKWGRGTAWVVVESELDGWLLHQEVGDLVGVLAMGSAQARPDQETHRLLTGAGLILVSLDSDAAGAREAWGWWRAHYPNAKRWPVPIGKDPSEAYQKGLDLRAWVMAGLPEEANTTTPAPEAATAHPEGPGATPAPGEGLSNRADRMAVISPFPTEWRKRYDERTLERLAIQTVDGGLTDLAAAEVVGNC
jgi:hypothetical protein